MKFRVLFPFCGLGAGALGFLRASAVLFGEEATFESVGGIDFDRDACRDFETLTSSPALCADIAKLTVAQLVEFAGADAPDVVFSSPPCQGYSGLMSDAKSKEDKYQALNELVLTWTKLMLAAWPKAPPKLVLIENVPRIETRGKKLLTEVKRLLRAHGYVFHASTHDCGEIGGLAQHRQRYLLVARHASSTPSFLYQPIKRRVRGCGEVLAGLPLPGTPSAGPLHELPKISTLNWIRLALIPPGGDWRSIEGALERRRFNNVMRVIRGKAGGGAFSVADPRVETAYPRTYGVLAWSQPSASITGNTGTPGGGPFSVADERITTGGWSYTNALHTIGWDDPARTVTGGTRVGAGAQSVCDPRLGCAPYNGAYGVVGWHGPAATITASLQIDNGPAAVADPRIPGCPALRVAYFPHDARSAPPWPLVLPTEDGTWHRPLTTLELAALQGLPTTLDGQPLKLAGTSSTEHRRRIGNAVPVAAAEAIARQMLITLVSSAVGAFRLSGDGAVWVKKREQDSQKGRV